MFIMASEPAKGMTAAEVEAYYADKHSPQDLADAYAITHNQFWWVEDNEYDFEVGSPEHKAARMVTDVWCRLMQQYQERIFDILRSEGIEIPATGQIVVLTSFMKKYRSHFLRPVDTLESDAFISTERKAYFADLIVDAVSQGIDEREALKAVCEKAGMTESESQSLFDPWGGTIRALCETGRLCHKVQEKKAYQLCPAFEPMAEEPARIELVRRYFTHFGPATIKDAAYFFGTTQTKVKSWLKRLPVTETMLDGKSYFYIDNGLPTGELPACLFLAGFDQLMLGYEKTESLFLPREHMRDIFNLAGIVRPAILVNGTVVGWWNLKNRKLKITLFSPADKKLIDHTATALWRDLKQIEYL